MKRRVTVGKSEARVLLDRYGYSARNRIYVRRNEAKAFALFLIDHELTTVSYPSLRFSGLSQDHAHSLVGIYTDIPSLKQIVDDLDEAERVYRAQVAAAIAA